MTLGKEMRHRLDQRAPAAEETLTHRRAPLTATCDFDRLDRLGCDLTAVHLCRDDATPFEQEELVRWAKRICEKVTYLLEPLDTIEVDARLCTALLRSRPPKEKEDQIRYYELVLERDGRLSLKRYCYDNRTRTREPIAFCLSHDQLEQLLDDLEVVFGEMKA